MYIHAGMVHEVEIVLQLEEEDECGDDLPVGEAGQRVLLARQQLVRLRRPVQDLFRVVKSYLTDINFQYKK